MSKSIFYDPFTDRAKANLLNEYLIVGINEEMDKFVELLEVQIPYIFKGASEKLKNQDHIRVTNHKDPVSEETKAGFIH